MSCVSLKGIVIWSDPRRNAGVIDYVATIFMTTLITGTTAADLLIQNLVPITLAAVAVVVIISVGFGRAVIPKE